MPFSTRKSRANPTNVTGATTSTTSKLKLLGSRNVKQVQKEATATSPHSTNASTDLAKDDHEGEGKEPDEDVGSLSFGKVKEELEVIVENSYTAAPKLPSSTTKTKTITILEEVGEEGTIESTDWQVVTKKQKSTAAGPAVAPVYRPRGSALASTNWRRGNGTGLNASGYTAPRTAGGRSRATSQRTAYTGANIFFGISVGELFTGAIVWHMDTRECYNEGTATQGADIFKSDDGQSHIRKGRFWLIESVHEYHFNDLPIYTYNGKGIVEKKSEALKMEHIGIRPPHTAPERYLQQNAYPPLEIESLKDTSEKLHELSVLHFTEQHATSFDTKIRIVGTLKGDSITRVRQLRAQFGC